MRIHELKLQAHKNRVRRGRGISAGRGKTAGRGTKGQNSRTGGGVRPGFEGGQNPLSARLPKLPGFKSRRAKKQTVTLGQLEKVKSSVIDNKKLAEAGITQRQNVPVKLVLGGKLTSAKTIKLQDASAAAIKAIQKQGGKFTANKIPTQAHANTDKKTKPE